MPQMEWIWLIALILFAVLEAATTTLVSLWFIGGSLAAMIAALCGAEVWLQILLFFAVSALLLLAVRPLARKYLFPRAQPTNARGNIGKRALVTERIDTLNGKGAVKIDGVEWSARTQNEKPIEVGTLVRITDIVGAKVCVEPVVEPVKEEEEKV
ncbi:MAG: NfeD family protein [Faecousia sp.]